MKSPNDGFQDTERRNLLWWIAIGAVIVRLAYAGLQSPPGPASSIPDPDSYVRLAHSFADSWRLYELGLPSARREPVCPILLGLFFEIFGFHYWSLVGLNCLLGLLSIFLLFEIGREFFGETVAIIAAAIAAFYPPFIYYSAQALRETTMAFMGLFCVWTLINILKDPNASKFLAGGCVNALGALTNTTFLPFGLILAPAALLWLCHHSWPRRMMLVSIYGAAFVLLYSLWPVRNYLVFKTWILGSTAGAASTFYMYLVVPEEVGGTPQQDEIIFRDPVNQQGAVLAPIPQEQFFWKAAVARIKRYPIGYVRHVAWRLIDMWRLWPRPRQYAHSYAVLKWISIASDGWIIPLAFLGMLLVRLKPPPVSLIYLFVFSINGVHALIFTMIRYRFSLMPWMILFAACSLNYFWNKRRDVVQLWPFTIS